MKLITLLLIVLSALYSLHCLKTIYLSPFGNDETGDGSEAKPFKSLSFGINAAPDVILLQPGVYPGSSGTTFFKQPIKIAGTSSDPRRTSIVAPGNFAAGSDVTLENLSFNKFPIVVAFGKLTMNKCILSGTTGSSTLSVDHSSAVVTISNSQFFESAYSSISINEAASVTIQNSEFMKSAYGLFCYTCYNVLIQDSIFRDNRGQGIAITDGCSVTMKNTTASNNEFGGVAVNGGSLTAVDSLITGNRGVNGSGILITGSSTLYLSQVTLRNNTSTGFGGGFYCSSNSVVYMTDMKILENTADVAGSGECVDKCAITIDSSVVEENVSRSGVGSRCKDIPSKRLNMRLK